MIANAYAMLSEFNKDQIALKEQAEREAVKIKFENTIETQQRVITSIRKSDEETMSQLLDTDAKLTSALNATHINCLNTTKLSENYKIPGDAYSHSYQSLDQIDCQNPDVETLCFVLQVGLGKFVEDYVFGYARADQIINTAELALTNVKNYEEFINSTFPGQALDPIEYAEHYLCQSNLNDMQNTVLPQLVDFVKSIGGLETCPFYKRLRA